MGVISSKLGLGLIAFISWITGFVISLIVLLLISESITDQYTSGVAIWFIYFGIAMAINTFCFYSLFFLLRWLFGKN